MRHLIFVFSAFFLIAGFQVHAQSSGAAEAVVNVSADESGNWQVEYSFSEPQEVLVFVRSDADYRELTWTPETDDARFGRVAGIDTIVLDKPSKKVSFSIIPLTSNLVADYTPFVTFSDGSIAIYEGQFTLAAVDSIETVEALDGTTRNLTTAPLRMDVVVSSDKPIIVDGEVHSNRITHRIEGDGTYIYLGDGKVETFGSFTAVLDKRLPAWLRDRFDSDLEAIFAGFEELWGFQLQNKATVMLAYKGDQSKGFTASGGALDQLLMMEVGGQNLSAPDADMLSYLQWFFAHEAAHLFQIDRGVRFAGDGDSWIHEGAANTMAYGLIASMLEGDAGDRFLASVYANAFDECVKTLDEGPLATAAERDAFPAHYSCGDFVALATDGFLKRRNLYEFWNQLIGMAQGEPDKRVDEAAYFSTMRILGGTIAQTNAIRNIVNGRPENARKALTGLLEKAGLEPQFSAGGQLISLNWPDYSAE